MCRALFKILLILFVSSSPALGQSDCSDVIDFIRRFKNALSELPSDPGSDAARDEYLISLSQSDPRLYHRLISLGREGSDKMKVTESASCYQQEFSNVPPQGDDISLLSWGAHLFKRFPSSGFISPEFEKGFGLHLDLNQGVADFEKSTEAYSAAARALVTYTFSNKSTGTGGRTRLMAGVSAYYQNTDWLIFANPRAEFRIMDIGNKITDIGNIKAILDMNFGDTWIIGVGPGLELHNFGLQLLYQRQGEDLSNHFLLGVFYRFGN